MAAKRKRKRTTKRKKRTSTKRSKRRTKKSGPTAFQKFLMRDPAAAKRKMGW